MEGAELFFWRRGIKSSVLDKLDIPVVMSNWHLYI